MKKIIVAILSIATIGTIASCKKSDDSSPTTARMMFFNGTIAASGIDATVNSTKVSGATNIAFLNKTGYIDVPVGSVPVGYLLNTTQTNLISSPQNLTAGANYSAFAGGIITTPSLVFTSDDLTAPSSGNAKIRLINLSPDGLNENVYIGSNNTALISGVAAQTGSAFAETSAGTVKITVQDPTKPTQQVALNSQPLASGKIYTIILTGSSVSSGTSALSLTVLNNN